MGTRAYIGIDEYYDRTAKNFAGEMEYVWAFRNMDGYPDGDIVPMLVDLIKLWIEQKIDNTINPMGWIILWGADDMGEIQGEPNSERYGEYWLVATSGVKESIDDGMIDFVYVVSMQEREILIYRFPKGYKDMLKRVKKGDADCRIVVDETTLQVQIDDKKKICEKVVI